MSEKMKSAAVDHITMPTELYYFSETMMERANIKPEHAASVDQLIVKESGGGMHSSAPQYRRDP